MSMNIAQDVRQLVADTLSVSLEEITDSSSPETLTNWDSLQHLNLVLAIEQTFELQLLTEEIERLHNVGSIVALVVRKMATP